MMKTSIKLLALGGMLLGLGPPVFGQGGSVTNATATAKIVLAISVTKSLDMDFGTIIKDYAGGTVTIPVNGSSRTNQGVSLGSVEGTAAKFHADGTEGCGFAITFPSTITLRTGDGGANETMNVTLATNLTDNNGVLTTEGLDFNIGGTLTIAADQVAGLYNSVTPFAVSVDYN